MRLLSPPKKILKRGMYKLLSGEVATDEYLVGYGKDRKRKKGERKR